MAPTPDLNLPIRETIVELVRIFLAAAIATVVLFFNRLISFSVDLPHHLSLAQTLRESPFLSEGSKSVLSGMYMYPNWSHQIAAVLMNVGFDPIQSLNVTGIASAVSTWACLLYLSVRGSLWGAAVFVAVSFGLVASVYPGVTIGYEIIGNYFFAQIVGDTLFIASAILGWSILASGRTVLLVTYCLLALVIEAYVHLLPAVRLLAVIEMLLLISAAREWFLSRGLNLWAIGGAAIAPVILYLHPSYSAMKTLAENDGALEFGFKISSIEVSLLAASILALSLVGSALAIRASQLVTENERPQRWTWVGHPAILLFIIAIGTAAAALAQVFQYVVLDAGSNYAVKKHVFGLVTFGAASLGALVGVTLRRLPGIPLNLVWISSGLSVVLSLLLANRMLSLPNVVDVPLFRQVTAGTAEIARRIEQLDTGSIGGSPVFISSGYSGVENYFLTVAVLLSPQAPQENSITILNSKADLAWEQISYFVTLEGDPAYFEPSCQIGQSVNRVVLQNADCVRRARFEMAVLTPEKPIMFTISTAGRLSLVSGWWPAESWGAWSKEATALVNFDVGPDIQLDQYYLRIEANGFVSEGSPERVVSVKLNDNDPVPVRFTLLEQSTSVDLKLTGVSSNTFRLLFEIQNPVSPQQLGLSVDGRQLGIGLKSASLVLVEEQPN